MKKRLIFYPQQLYKPSAKLKEIQSTTAIFKFVISVLGVKKRNYATGYSNTALLQ